jgi:hypothetical protein
VNKRSILSGAAAAALLLSGPAAAAEPVDLLAPEPPACEAAAAERAALAAERAAIDETIGDIALGRSPRKRRGPSGAAVAREVAGAAASALLPLGAGLLVRAGVAAAGRKRGKAKPAARGPDVPAMIARRHAIDARLFELAECSGPGGG